jgi:hypothetical protein
VSSLPNRNRFETTQPPHEIALIVEHGDDVSVSIGRFFDERVCMTSGIHDVPHRLRESLRRDA